MITDHMSEKVNTSLMIITMVGRWKTFNQTYKAFIQLLYIKLILPGQ